MGVIVVKVIALISIIVGFFGGSFLYHKKQAESKQDISLISHTSADDSHGCSHDVTDKIQNNCLFCQIGKGLKPATIYVQNNSAYIMRSLSGGILAISYKHIGSLNCLEVSQVKDLADMLVLASKTAHKQFAPKQYQSAYFHTGSRAGQTQFHIHMHMSLRDTKISVKKVLPDKESRLIAENNYDTGSPYHLVPELRLIDEGPQACVYVIPGDQELLVHIRKPTGHLASLTYDGAEQIAYALVLATRALKKHYPSKDYQTHIVDAIDDDGLPTVTIRIRLY